MFYIFNDMSIDVLGRLTTEQSSGEWITVPPNSCRRFEFPLQCMVVTLFLVSQLGICVENVRGLEWDIKVASDGCILMPLPPRGHEYRLCVFVRRMSPGDDEMLDLCRIDILEVACSVGCELDFSDHGNRQEGIDDSNLYS
ncbi:hypothetical protein H4217_001550 [Coemansia sp. RSA 1939]|nr:hypothetical protein H4217_001550 [Coemansia sp. RSA 1939]